MTRARAIAIALLFAASSAFAADFSVRSEVDAQKLGVEDQVRLTITLTGASGEIPLPGLTNLTVVGGPFTSHQVSFVNGAITQSQASTYVLQPQAAGRAEIGAVQARVGNEQRTAPGIALEVVAGSILRRQQQAPADPFDPFSGEDPLETLLRNRRGGGAPGPSPKIFLEAAVDRNRVHVGEPVLLTYYLYTQTSVTDMRATETPQYPGLWSEELEKPKQSPGGEPATVNGESFRRFAIDQKLLFPTRAGTITIPPLTMKLAVARGGGFFDPMSGSATVDRATKPVTITALPIPETPGFSGAVGHFTVSATLDKDPVTIGDAATLRFEVKGEGNLKWVDKAPELSLTGAKVYPPQVKSDLHTTPTGIAGTKTWELVLVPETGGTIAIPPFAFTFFDPTTGQLATARTGPLEMHVLGSAAAGGGVPPAGGPAPVTAGNAGPLVLRSDLDRPSSLLPTVATPAVTFAVVLTLLLHAGFFGGTWWGGRRRTASGHPTPARDVRKALTELSRAEHDGLSKEAAMALIERSLHEVFGALEEDSAAETERERAARQVLRDVHFIRYAPQLGDYSDRIRELARKAEDVVRRYA